jgi:DNA-binding IclR family transcriptional regulator
MSKIVERTLDFLEVFAAEKRPLSLSEISRLLSIPVSSCHDVLRALQDRGYIYEVAPRAGHYPTQRLHDVAWTIAAHDPVLQRAEVLLRKLRDSLDESVLLAKVSGLEATYLVTLEPSHPLRFLVKVGDTIRSLYATSAGKALLAGLDEAALKACLRTMKLEPFTRHTIRTKSVLRSEIEVGRQRKWFLNREESQDGVMTLSASFVWRGATFIVTVAGPLSRIEPHLAHTAAMLVDTCRRLEKQPIGDGAIRRGGALTSPMKSRLK